MLTIKNITIKNFMSVGAVVQPIKLDEYGLTLILGDNIDQGSNGSRNGAGKTVILHALNYALFGSPMTNIKMDNLINKSNKKHMHVTVSLEKDGHAYKIERGRKPNVFKFFVDNAEVNKADTDEAQGDMRRTQDDINELLGFSSLLFKHIIGLSSKTTPFLNEKAQIQREMIEELLGVTMLSEKAVVLKELLKETKLQIEREEYRIKIVQSHNEQTEKTIRDITAKAGNWDNVRLIKSTKLANDIESLMEVDIEQEIANHKTIQLINTLEKDVRDAGRNLNIVKTSFNNLESQITKSESNYKVLLDQKCHTCGQSINDDKHISLIEKSERELASLCEKFIPQEENFINASNRYVNKKHQLEELGVKPISFYKTIDEAYEHKTNLDQTMNTLENLVAEKNPYIEQIATLTENNMSEIDYGEINELVSVKDHQEFLLRLLSDKNSFIRRRIIEQNLGYLNHRLDYYLQKLGLPHKVKFLSDLSVEIIKAGQDFDFDNLSTGESTRLILALSMGFRDMFETMNTPINLLFIDELIDNGMDMAGGENALAVLKNTTREQNKNIFLVSHKDEFVARVSNVLMVTKESDFTTYQYESDLQV